MTQIYEREFSAANGTYTIDGMDGLLETGVASVYFRDAAKNLVTPTAGTIAITCADHTGQYHSGIPVGDISANSCGLDATYVKPVFNGGVISSKIIVSGFTAGTAETMVVSHWRS